MLARLLAITAALLALAACGRPNDPRFDAIPGPLSTVDIAIAVASEPQPLTLDEWASLEALHDRYLIDYDRLRIEVIAPLVQEVRRDHKREWMEDPQALARFTRRHAMVVGRVRALDESFAVEVEKMLPAHPTLAARLGDRRAIARSARIIEGLGDGSADAATILDLEPQVRDLKLDPAQRAAVEPTLAAYRRELAQAAQALAEAEVDQPRARLAALAAAGVDDARYNELRAHAGESAEARAAAEAAEAARAAAEREAARPIMRALQATDIANQRLVEQLLPLLSAEDGQRLVAAAERRRTSDTAGIVDYSAFVLEVYRHHPAVREGRAPRVAAAIARVDAALAQLRSAQIELDRARLERSVRGLVPQDPPEAKRIQELGKVFTEASTALVAAVKDSLQDDLASILEHAREHTPDQMRELLAPTIGEAAADRAVSRASRDLFRNPLEKPPEDWDHEKSIAEQLLLAPMMDRGGFRLAARALGARDDDPLVDQLWDRHQARGQEIEGRQRTQFKALESKAEEDASGSEQNPDAFERTLAQFLDALLAADAERRAADEETFREIAIALGLQETDARFVLARAVSAARRAQLPWRRFDQAWMLGALWEAEADPISMALEIEGDDVARQAALVVLTAHAQELTQTADGARRAGLEGLRDLLLLGLRSKKTGGPSDIRELRETPAARAIVQRVTDASRARRRAQRAAVQSVVEAVGGERGGAFFAEWVMSTFPEFFAEGRQWREARSYARSAAGGETGARSDAGHGIAKAAAERWKLVEDDMVHRLAQWQDERTAMTAPAIVADLATAGAADADLGALRTLRDENAWRLLRAAATAAGEAPDARLGGDEGTGAPPRVARWAR
ncbi:MAG: hypothetical protein U0625_04335 [Phycisphaerales bacterium]